MYIDVHGVEGHQIYYKREPPIRYTLIADSLIETNRNSRYKQKKDTAKISIRNHVVEITRNLQVKLLVNNKYITK